MGMQNPVCLGNMDLRLRKIEHGAMLGDEAHAQDKAMNSL
jgi:hypothetical protein